MNQKILNRQRLMNDYSQYLDQLGYQLVDLNLVETYQNKDKGFHPTTIVFEYQQRMMMVRSDWTRSLWKYRQAYASKQRFFAYVGPVVRHYKTLYQAGVELYQPSQEEIVETIDQHLQFIQAQGQTSLQHMVVSSDHLLQAYLDLYQVDEQVLPWVYEKNLSALQAALGKNQPLVCLMRLPVSQQYEAVAKDLGDHEDLTLIQAVIQRAQADGLKVSLDLSFRSPQTYYQGFYCQVFSDPQTVVMSGGCYEDQAFGLALNVTEGVFA